MSIKKSTSTKSRKPKRADLPPELRPKIGRPREHDRDAIALELIEWSMKPDSINLNGFCCSRVPPLAPSKITQWALECDYFRQAYEAAKTFIAVRREERLSAGTLHVKAYDLNSSVYDHFLKDERRAQARFEASLKDEKTEESEEDKTSKDSLFNSILEYQKRQIDLTRKRIESKSAAVAGEESA